MIDNFFESNPFYGGCFSSHSIKRNINPNEKKFYIVNLDYNRNAGTHWTLVSFIDPTTGIYFDSFAVPPPQTLYQFMKKHRKENIMNSNVIQKLSSENCGYYCCYVGKMLSEYHRKFVDIMNDFSVDEKWNERFITSVFN